MRHSTHPRRNFRVRLACVKHAASVQSEPESNSPVQICCKDSRWTEIRISKFFPLALHLSMNHAPFRSAREAFLRSPQRLVNFFFRFSENFFRRPAKFSATAKFAFMKISRRLSRSFLTFPRRSRAPASFPNRRRWTLRRRPPFVKLFVESF